MTEKYRVRVHYTIGKTVNIDDYTCSEWASDIEAGVLRLTNGKDLEGNEVMSIQYREPWRVLMTRVGNDTT